MMVGIVYDSNAYSFSKVARLTYEGLAKIGYKQVFKTPMHTTLAVPPTSRLIYVYDTSATAVRPWVRFRADKVIVWSDSSIDPETFSFTVPPTCCHIQCHPFWASLYNKLGLRTDGWIPRPVDDDVIKEVLSTPKTELCKDVWSRVGNRYIINVASEIKIPYPKPRKGLDMYDKLCGELRKELGVECLYVGNQQLKHAVPVVGSGSLPEYTLLKLVRCASLFVWTSRSEGFGMPPVEAMAVGTPVVCSNAPFNSLIRCFTFPYKEEISVKTPYGFSFREWDYDYRDLRDTVFEVMNQDPQEIEAFSAESSKNALKFFSKSLVAQALMDI